jgi:hypothetical protein
MNTKEENGRNGGGRGGGNPFILILGLMLATNWCAVS